VKDRINISPIERLCVDKGLRMTDQRRILARVLSTTHDHPDIEELHRRVRQIDSRISLSTVYRTVGLFCRTGIIGKHNFGFGRAQLEPAPDKPHNHLVDIRSGNVVEFRSDEIEHLLTDIANQLGYRIVEHRFELYAVPIDRTDQRSRRRKYDS
jgi:Fur family ferric uptake transcriptional regulator